MLKKDNNNLLKTIEKVRQEMIKLAENREDKKLMEKSQQLDRLINYYYKS